LRYRAGIVSLVAGAPHAVDHLQAAVVADPAFQLAHVALAAALAARGEEFVRPPLVGPVSRAERHHIEIIEAMCSGDRVRAMDLRREHLLEHPGDLLVVWIPFLVA
jgi:hypothetical protein